jgi:hypothetical protein
MDGDEYRAGRAESLELEHRRLVAADLDREGSTTRPPSAGEYSRFGTAGKQGALVQVGTGVRATWCDVDRPVPAASLATACTRSTNHGVYRSTNVCSTR